MEDSGESSSQIAPRRGGIPSFVPEWVFWVREQRDAGGSPADVPPPDEDEFQRDERTVSVLPKRNRRVNRKLNGIHLSMITVNAVLGSGLYWRGGQILELAGPLAVLLSFLLVGFVAWAVMQCITEMLCIWPVPGALQLYVSEFVDAEAGIAVGVAYWFTYSVSFAALVATAAAEIGFWNKGNKLIDGLVVYSLVPIILVCLNFLPVKWFGHSEVFFATVKLTFYVVIVCALIAINRGAGGNEVIGDSYWHDVLAYDTLAVKNWGVGLITSISISAYAYVGVEVVAASALEARWPTSKRDGAESESGNELEEQQERVPTDLSQRSKAPLLIGSTVKFSAIWIAVISTIVYVVGGAVAASNIPRDNCHLPRFSWVDYSSSNESCSSKGMDGGTDSSNGTTSSAFVIIAQQAGMPHLADAFNFFLVFTALTCANTNLFVAARSLFGLTSRLDSSGGGHRRNPVARVLISSLAWIGRTDSRRIPRRAMLVSAAAFIWVPLLQLKPGGENGDTSTPIGMFIEILAQMGSVGVIIVWACECYAFIRFYRCIWRHRDMLERLEVPHVRRWDEKARDYPYRSFGQPVLAWVALIGCLFILFVCNGAQMWSGWATLPFLSAYLITFVFVALVALLKLVRGSPWRQVDLRNEVLVLKKIHKLNEIRWGAS